MWSYWHSAIDYCLPVYEWNPYSQKCYSLLYVYKTNLKTVCFVTSIALD